MVPGEFSKNVIRLALQIPPGRVTAYGYLTAAAGGHPMLSRMVTSILSKHTNPNDIPWHRIVYSDGRVWVDPKHHQERLRRYQQEGIKLDKNNKIINFEKLVYIFNEK